MVKNIVVLGLQWGDEGKGKIVDLLTPYAKYVVRYQGGHNAGHTIIVDQQKVILHLVPSGILHNHVINIIAGGVVLSPASLIQEITSLKKVGILVHKRIFISAACPLIFTYHIAMDKAREVFKSNSAIGTTGCGIGPAYEDKIARRALRVGDLYHKNAFKNKLREIMHYYNFQLVHFYNQQPVDYQMVLKEIMMLSDILINMIIDVPKVLGEAQQEKSIIIFEGAQGSLLDIDHGTYPYVTSANTIAGAAGVGAGIGLRSIDYILGVVKAYSTRVGNGPFPTELSIDDDIGSWLSLHGNEFGATTKRRRRIGWFDAVLVRYAVKINSLSSCCLTKIDVLDGLQEVKICIGYRKLNGEVTCDCSYILDSSEYVTPIYETLSGWSNSSTAGIKVFDQLPQESQCYIKRIEELIGVPIDIISTGSGRSDVIILRNPLNF